MKAIRKYGLAGLLAFSSAVAATPAAAVEAGDAGISERWSVVGVIAGDEGGGRAVGIVVLRHNASKRTYTLAIGDNLPNEFAYTLRSVKNRVVQVSDGRQPVTLAFAEPAADEGQDEQNRTARFIDSYYRSLSEQPIDGVALADEPSGRAAPVPARRFTNLREDMAPRYDLYRNERGAPDSAYRGDSSSGYDVPAEAESDPLPTRYDTDGFPDPPPAASEYRSTDADTASPSDDGPLTVISE